MDEESHLKDATSILFHRRGGHCKFLQDVKLVTHDRAHLQVVSGCQTLRDFDAAKSKVVHCSCCSVRTHSACPTRLHLSKLSRVTDGMRMPTNQRLLTPDFKAELRLCGTVCTETLFEKTHFHPFPMLQSQSGGIIAVFHLSIMLDALYPMVARVCWFLPPAHKGLRQGIQSITG